jgi:hypothetical protein
MICKENFRQITGTHLQRKHEIRTVAEYKKIYPYALIIDGDISNRLRNNFLKTKNKYPDKIGFKKGEGQRKEFISWNKGLTKEVDRRIYKQSINQRGPFTEEHRRKISETRTKRQKYEHCIKCGVKKGKTTRKLCIFCARKKLITKKDYINPMKGREISDEHKRKLWGGWKTRYTKPELKVLNSYSNLIYTGDGKLWISFRDGSCKNPDIVYLHPKYKIAIEIFGDYWHRNDDPEETKEKYSKVGWRCLILWEHQVN